MRITSARKDIGRYLFMNILTEHQESCNSDEGVEKILPTAQ